MSAISTQHLVKLYGHSRGLAGLDLEVHPGEVYGFLGPNGAGKSTTIRLLLDLIRPTSGTARVLGLDPQRQGVQVRRQVGYLPGEFVVEGRQSARMLLGYLARLRGRSLDQHALSLAERLELELDRPLRTLSKGNRQKVGLVQAFMHEPALLVLDEPTSGLDPLLQQEFLAMVREVRRDGRTVFMSSHAMDEVQHVADRVGLVRAGVLVATQSVEDLREHVLKEVTITFEGSFEVQAFTSLEGFELVSVEGQRLQGRIPGSMDALVKAASGFTVVDLRCAEPDLEDLFLSYYGGR